jgi:hypothetical protein
VPETTPKRPTISVTDVKRTTPHNAALLEAGKAMLLDSIDVGRDFCKTMITVCSGAVPIHVALIGLAAGKDFDFDTATGALALAAPLLYLGALCVFAFGYFPSRGTLSIENLDSIEQARVHAVERRYGSAQIGVVIFVVGVLMTLAAAIYFFSQPAPAPPNPSLPGATS